MKLAIKVSVLVRLAIAILLILLLAWTFWANNQKTQSNSIKFVKDVYEKLYHQGSTISSLDKADEIYSSTLAELVRQEQLDQKESGEIGKLSADPLCNCQDPASVQNIEIVLDSEDERHATVVVSFSVSDSTEKLKLDLLEESTGWKIDDVAGENMPSLRHGLMRK